MIGHALDFGFAAVSLALLMNLWCLLRGPGVADRVLAVDTMVINVIVLIVFYGIRARTPAYFEAALILAMFGFVSTVAYCRFVLRGDVIE